MRYNKGMRILMKNYLSRQKDYISYLGIAASVPSCTVYITHAMVGKKFSVHNKAVFSLVNYAG